MDNGKISVRYARALFNLACQQQCEAEVYDCLVRLTKQYSLAINPFTEVLSNPMIPDSEKIQLIMTAIGEPIHPCLKQFLDFVTEKKRANKIFLIALKYQEMYRKAKKILRADVTTATELSDETLNKIKAFVEQTFEQQAEMHVSIDPKLIGGFTLDIEHDRLDASITGQLNKLKTELQL